MQASQVELPSKRGECSSPCDVGESQSSNHSLGRHGYRLFVERYSSGLRERS